MIKEIFLPEKTKTRRLISQRIVGITIDQNTVRAAQILATSTGTQILNVKEVTIEPGAPAHYTIHAAQALKEVLAQCSRYDQLRVAIPASTVAFKDLVIPFTDPEKIRMVIEFEVEPLLPFSVHDAVIDFIITETLTEENASRVLVAAVQNEDLQKIFNIYQEAGVDPSAITIDLFALYGLYLQTPEYKNLPHATALIDIGATSTRVAFLLNGKLRLIRNIAKGLDVIAEHISQDISMPIPDVIAALTTSGTQHPENGNFSQAAQKYISHLLNDVQFTLNSFSLKLNFYEEISKILLVGVGAQIANIANDTSTFLQIPCENFSCEKVFKVNNITHKAIKDLPSWVPFAIPLGTALVYTPHDEFNLRKKSFARTADPLVFKQLLTAGILIIALLTTILVSGFLEINSLKTTYAQKEQQEITKLKGIFSAGDPALKKPTLKNLTTAAENVIRDRDELWRPFRQEKLKPLDVLLDLTQTIDKRRINFDINISSIKIYTEETGMRLVDVSGTIKSKEGNYKAYGNFKEYFNAQSKRLTRKNDIEGTSDEAGGLPFTLNLKFKEQ